MDFRREESSRSMSGRPLRVMLSYKNMKLTLEGEPASYDELVANAYSNFAGLAEEITVRTHGGNLITSSEELALTLKAAKTLGQSTVKLEVGAPADDDLQEASVSEVMLVEEKSKESSSQRYENRREEPCAFLQNSNPDADEPKGSLAGGDV